MEEMREMPRPEMSAAETSPTSTESNNLCIGLCLFVAHRLQLVLLAAVVVVNSPSRAALQQRPRPARAAGKGGQQQLATGFHQPGYNPRDPKGLWGKGVPPEYRDIDYEMIKSLAAVEQDLDTGERLAASLALPLPAMRGVAGTGQQLAVGGIDIEGGQGESDAIFGSHDDHSTYGVVGSGWQGAGNGEPPGELWNPAVGRTRVVPGQQLRMWQQALAGPVPYPQPGPEWYETEWGVHKHGN
jgi:hypothetical protein